MTEIRPLLYFGPTTLEQGELTRKGKELLDVDFLVRPVRVTEDSVGVALSFGHPDYCYLYGYVNAENAKTPERMRNALACLFGIDYVEYRETPASWLSRVLGCEVTEIEEES